MALSKSHLRDLYKQKRRAMDAAYVLHAVHEVTHRVVDCVSHGVCVAGYVALARELDVFPALSQLPQTALPYMTGKDQPLLFRQWRVGDALQPSGIYTSIREPLDSAAIVIPDIVLVPLLAFDRKGHRLGYGGGFYDRTLDLLRQSHKITAIGVAYAVQEADNLPQEADDQRLDIVITEKETIYL